MTFSTTSLQRYIATRTHSTTVPHRFSELHRKKAKMTLITTSLQQLHRNRTMMTLITTSLQRLHCNKIKRTLSITSLQRLHCNKIKRTLSTTSFQRVTWQKDNDAVSFALNKFHYLINGAPVIVKSDRNPLSYIKDCAPKSAKLIRWALALQEYDLFLLHERCE